jgi:hypothetical protein
MARSLLPPAVLNIFRRFLPTRNYVRHVGNLARHSDERTYAGVTAQRLPELNHHRETREETGDMRLNCLGMIPALGPVLCR